MGSSSWSPSDWVDYSKTTARKSTSAIFDRREIDKDLDPKGVVVRESRDSVAHPRSHAIIVALDVTGSMGVLAETLVRKGVGVLVEELIARKPVADPHLMIMGVGDAGYDDAPLQVTQFETDIRIAEQLEKVYIEHGGGGNNYESYTLPWYFAALHTAIDCYEKRGKKGYLFTVGDENPPPRLSAEDILEFIGDGQQGDMDTKDLLALVSQRYEIFHLVVTEGDYASANLDKVMSSWRSVLGQRVLPLRDHTKLAEVIVSAIEVNEGRAIDTVAKSWDGSTGIVVRDALTSMMPRAALATSVTRF